MENKKIPKCTDVQRRAMKKYQDKNREKINEYGRNYSKTYYVTYKEMKNKELEKKEKCFKSLNCIKKIIDILDNNEDSEKYFKGINSIRRLVQLCEC